MTSEQSEFETAAGLLTLIRCACDGIEASAKQSNGYTHADRRDIADALLAVEKAERRILTRNGTARAATAGCPDCTAALWDGVCVNPNCTRPAKR